MKVTTKDILNIKKGTSCTFRCDHPKNMNCAKQLACYAHRMHPEMNVTYSCHLNWDNNEITITANPVVKPKKVK